MATTRKRTSGFSEKPKEDESTEQKELEQMLDVLAQETFEEISQKEAIAPVFVPQEIIPTEDVGPRFLEPEVTAVPAESRPEPQLKAPPKRHPRNIPKFSRFK